MDNCKINGILFCFYNDLQNIIKTPPKEYNQTKINQIYSDSKDLLLSLREVPEQSEGGGFIKPNVIIILSESFWDVTNLSKIKYSEDPIKNIRKDIKSSFKSPSFGGGTANVEFELLTGLSNYFLKGTTPYSSQIINRPIPTLFTLFKDQGYLTTVIHPYLSSMYNRKTVYKNFSLDNFISIENLSGYKNIGPYVSDESFNEELIKQLNSVNQSQLIFGISMQNHVVFEPNNYSKNLITFQSPLSSKENSILQSYVNGISLTDQYYSDFKKELDKIKKPTIILLFGDHLTSLGEGFDIYQKSGFDTNDEDKLHSTPIAVWANYPINITLPQNISPSFLSVEILKLANITPKYQFSFLDSLFKEGTTLNTYSENKFSQDQLKNYELIQYDLVFGKQYLLKN